MIKQNFTRVNFTSILVLFSIILLSCEHVEIPEKDSSLQFSDIEDSRLTAERYIIVFNNEGVDNLNLKQEKNYAKSQEIMLIRAKEILKNSGVEKFEINHVYSSSIRGVSIKLDENQVEQLKQDKNIKYIEKDRYELMAPPCGTKNGGPCEESPIESQIIPYGVQRVGGISNYTGSRVAWIIDSGIDIDHPDLNVDISRGYRAPEVAPFLLENPFDDDNGHGTHIAGTIGAINNEIGVIGVAPGVTVIPVKVLGENNYGWWTDIIAGIDYVAANGNPGDVANLSIGGGAKDAVDEAVIAASSNGIWFVIAAGNNASDANNTTPGRANGDFVITISAMDVNDNWATFSNYGNPPIDYVAPGVNVISTDMGGTYSYKSGTSMAAPHAAGVILLAGMPGTDGTFVNGDPDGNPDQVIYFNDLTNTIPEAGFTYQTNLLAVQFIDSSTDSDGSITDWSWNFGDGQTSSSQNPVYTFAAAGNYIVSLTVTDDAGGSGSTSQSITVNTEEPPPGDIVLSGTGYKVRGKWNTDLVWTPSGTSSQVDVYRNGSLLITTNNNGTFTDVTNFNGSGSLNYRVCESGTTVCSNEITVQF